jgi:hypothetical protein
MSSLINVLILGAATVAASEPAILRREAKSVSLHLGAGGQMVENSDFSRPQEQMATKINTCDDDFPLGQLNKNDCTEPHFDYAILNREMCIEAAREAGVTTVHSKFEVPAEGGWREAHPRGCFKIECSEAHAAHGHAVNASDAEKAAAEAHTSDAGVGYCYFYNPRGSPPPQDNGELEGVPVCHRPKIINGTVGDAPAGDSGKVVSCKHGFAVIDTENECHSAAECLGYSKGEIFDISQQVNEMYHDYPEGCFIHGSGRVYINLKPNQVDGQALWGHPSGARQVDGVSTWCSDCVPLCNVTEQTMADTWPTLSTTDHEADGTQTASPTAADAVAAAEAATTGDGN